MTTNTFDTEESNSNINSPQYFVDDDGSLKFISPVLSSSNFDGSVPVFEGQITASAISPGKFIKTGGEYLPVISVAYDDQELEESPSDEITVTYLDSNSEVQEIIYNLTDDVDVKYENWEEKYLGTQGWSLTYGGNAIFANVGVRGEIEATTLDVGGVDGITYDGETVTIGASVVINAPLNIGDLSASYTTFDFITASYADINDLQIPGQTIINGGNITTGVINASLITTGNLSGWTIDTNKIYTSQMTFDSANSRISVGPTNSPVGVLEKDIAGTGITLRCDSTTTAYGGTLPLARIDVTDAGSTAYGGIKLQALEFFGRGGGATIELSALYPTAYCNITAPFVNIESTFGTNLKYGFIVTDGAGTTVAECSSTGVFTGNGSGLTNLDGSDISTGTVAAARIADLAASKITSGTFDAARIPVPVTRATNANNLDSTVTGGATITGAGVQVTGVGQSTSSDILRRDGSNNLKVTNASTRKIKTDISPLEDITVLGVDVVKFKYIDGYLDENDQRVDDLIPGFIAEQVYEEIPIAVDLDENGEPRNWNDRIIIPIMVKTIQDQQKLIEDLEARVLQLESQLGG